MVSKERNVIPEDASSDTCQVSAFLLFSVSITCQYSGSLYSHVLVNRNAFLLKKKTNELHRKVKIIVVLETGYFQVAP